jgi:hypothetical protein
MAPMTYDEFLTAVFSTGGIGSELIAYEGSITVYEQSDRGLISSARPEWRFAEHDATGQWTGDAYRDKDLYLMVRWVTSAWGRNTTGEGALQTEPAKDLLIPICMLLDKICPAFTWAQAIKLFRAITSATLSLHGQYEETTGDGVLQEYEYTYAYHAVQLSLLYRWLVENGLL